MKKAIPIIRRVFWDIALVGLVLALSAVTGTAYFASWDRQRWPPVATAMDGPWFAPSVMVATGRGLVDTDASAIPELAEFLQLRRAVLRPDQLPAQIQTGELTDFLNRHRYLLYLTGVVWRFFGISWEMLKVLLVAFFCVTVGIVYGVFRLGMNRVLSTVGAILFMTAPFVLTMMASPRDFIKGPFILAVILVLGYLIKRRVTPRAFLGLALLLGAILGIGLGFRHDVLVCIPASLFVLAFCVRGDPALSARVRAAGAAVLLAAFSVCAWPVLRSLNESGTTSYLHIVTGLATTCEDDLGVERASYERMYLNAGDFIDAVHISYSHRVHDHPAAVPILFDSPEAARSCKRYLIEVVKTFPADMATFGLASVLRMLGDFPAHTEPRSALAENPFLKRLARPWRPLAAHLERFGVYYAIASLVLLSTYSLRVAWSVFFLLFYFCGYTCLQFQLRHCFHLSFVSIWFLGFLIDRILHAAGQLRQPATRQEIKKLLRAPRQWWAPPVKRAVSFSVCAVALMLVPFCAVRVYQCHAVSKLLDTYAAALLEPIETQAEPLNMEEIEDDAMGPEYAATWPKRRTLRDERPVHDWVLFRPSDRPGSEACAFNERDITFQTDYLAAAFAATGRQRRVWLRYEIETPSFNFSRILYVDPDAKHALGPTKYFFPIYEFEPGAFKGIAVPREQAGEFQGLFRVKNIKDFPLLLNLSLPFDRTDFRRFQALPWRVPDLPHAVAQRQAAMCARGDALAKQGRFEQAAQVYRRAIAQNPDGATPYGALDRIYVERDDLAGRVAQWRKHTHDNPHDALGHYYLGMALAAKQDTDGALAAFRKASEAGPVDPAMQASLKQAIDHCVSAQHGAGKCAQGEALAKQGKLDEAAQAYREAIATDPNSAIAYEALDKILLKMHDPDGRVAEWQERVRQHPDAAFPHRYLGMALAAKQDIAGAISAYGKARELDPKDASIARHLAQALVAKADGLKQNGDFDKALEIYREAQTLDPHSDWAKCGAGDVLVQRGDLEQAEQQYRAAIAANARSAAAFEALDKIYANRGSPQGRSDAWKRLAHDYPDAARAHFHLGMSLEASQDMDGAIGAYRKATQLDPTDAAMQVSLGLALVQNGDFHGAVEAFRAALKINPDILHIRAQYVAALSEIQAFDAAWQEVERCQELGIALPDDLVHEVKRRAGHSE